MNAHIHRLMASPPSAASIGRMALAVTVVLVLMVGYAAAGLVWQLLPGGQIAVAPPPQGGVAVERERSGGTGSGERLAGMHLLGRAAPLDQEREIPDDAPETRLNLALRGLLYSPRQSDALAIIGAGNDDESVYRVGDSVPGGASIDAIRVDRVVLLRNGRHEILTLPEQRVDASEAGPGLDSTPDNGEQAAMDDDVPAQDPGALRRQVLRNPSSMARYVNMEPYSDESGAFVGFQLNPGEDPGMMQTLGLQPGDVVTSLNGNVIDSPEAGMRALRGVARSDTVEVEVLRDGSRQTLQIDFSN